MTAGSTTSLPPTGLLYFLDASLLEACATTLEVRPTGRNNENGAPIYAVVLDRTIFHPQGGGQPSDVGYLVLANVGGRFRVEKAVVDREGGVVFHEGTFCTSATGCSSNSSAEDVCCLKPGDSVRMEVDEGPRKLHTRLHSAGHALDVVEARMHLNWLPGKGYHFPDGPYLEYSLGEQSFQVNAENKATLLSQMQRMCDDFVSGGCAVDISLDSAAPAAENTGAAAGSQTTPAKEEDRRSSAANVTALAGAAEDGRLNSDKKIQTQAQSSDSGSSIGGLNGSGTMRGDAESCRESESVTAAIEAATPTNIRKHQLLPTKATRRFVSMAGIGTFCGGTHVKDVKDIGRIKLTKIVCKKKAVRISYTVEEVALS